MDGARKMENFMDFPTDLKYTNTHEWVKNEQGIVKIGITAFALDQLKDIAYLNIDAAEGAHISKGDSFATIESVKAASDIYSPVSGTIVEVHKELEEMLLDLMKDAYEIGWMIAVKLDDPSELAGLLDAASYQKKTEEEH